MTCQASNTKRLSIILSISKNICIIFLTSLILLFFISNQIPNTSKSHDAKFNGSAIIDGATIKLIGHTLRIQKQKKIASLPRLIAEALYLDLAFNKSSPFMRQYGVSRNGRTVHINGLSVRFSTPEALNTLARVVGVQ